MMLPLVWRRVQPNRLAISICWPLFSGVTEFTRPLLIAASQLSSWIKKGSPVVFEILAAHMDGILDEGGYATLDEMGAEFCAIQGKIDEHLGASVLALACVLIGAIYDKSDEALPGLNRASLAAIRPQLVGAIAEDADRVLASDGEAA
jgi:hypothetical protein